MLAPVPKTSATEKVTSTFETYISDPSSDQSLHPTAQKLIDCTLNMLDTIPVEKIGIENVLDQSKVARSSLYYHFENFPHLVECAVAYRFVTETRQTIGKLQGALAAATCQDSFKKSVLELNELLQHPNRDSVRMQRVVAFASTDRNPRFMSMLKLAQQNLTNEYANTLLAAKEKSWIREDVDTYTCAVFVQAMTMGRIVDDVSTNKAKPLNWTEMTSKVLSTLLW